MALAIQQEIQGSANLTEELGQCIPLRLQVIPEVKVQGSLWRAAGC